VTMEVNEVLISHWVWDLSRRCAARRRKPEDR
jgi:hypothetical protein